MTDTERLILEGIAAALDLLRDIATTKQVYHSGKAKIVQDKIEAVLDSQTADEVDALK